MVADALEQVREEVDSILDGIPAKLEEALSGVPDMVEGGIDQARE